MKNKKSNSHFLMLAIVLAAIAGCKPVQVLREEKLMALPQSFDSNSDATPEAESLGAMDWREFFADQYLQNLIDTALIANFDLKIAAQRIQQMQAGVLAAEAPLRPTVQAAGAAGIRRFGLYTMDGAGNATTDITPGKIVPEHLPDFFIGAQAGWEIDLWGKLKNQKKSAIARFMASVEGKNLVQTAVVAGIAEAYFNLQSLDAQTLILDEYITLQQNALDLVRIQKESGAANELAVKQFENQLLDLRGMRLNLQQKTLEYESLINYLLGRFPQSLARTPLFLNQKLPDVAATGVPPAMLENRPDIRAAAFELAASKADLNAARALFYPSLNIGAMLGTQAFRPDFLVTTPASLAYNLAGGMMAPLANKRAIRAEFNRADAYQLEALTTYQQTIINAFTEAYNQVAFLKNLEQQFALKSEQVAAIENAVGVSSELFRSGRANYLEVLTAQQNALDTRFELVDLRLRQWQSAVGLYRALGGGWR
jgi:NodT family efflux transporter outer membrane factor (OMF) lipoprotein